MTALRVLLDAWDPIGVYGEPKDAPPLGEYDDVAPQLARMCLEGWTEDRISEGMHRWVEERCGISSDTAKDLALARAAIALWERSGRPCPVRRATRPASETRHPTPRRARSHPASSHEREGHPLKPGIRVEVLWSDEDLLALRVEASNGRFAASAEMYAGHGELAALADSLAGFPTSIDDRREVVLGTLDPASTESGVRMRFAVSDLSGHAAAHIRVRAPVEECRPEEETADLIVPVEAAGIDWFVATLRRMSPKPGSQAYLAQRI